MCVREGDLQHGLSVRACDYSSTRGTEMAGVHDLATTSKGVKGCNSYHTSHQADCARSSLSTRTSLAALGLHTEHVTGSTRTAHGAAFLHTRQHARQSAAVQVQLNSAHMRKHTLAHTHVMMQTCTNVHTDVTPHLLPQAAVLVLLQQHAAGREV